MTLKLTLGVKDRQKLRRKTYKLLDKMHDLERPRKFSKIYSKKMGDNPCVLLCFKELITLFAQSLHLEQDSHIKTAIEKGAYNLSKLQNLVENSISNGKPIKRGIIARCLRQHTEIFNLLNKYAIKTPEPDNFIWSKVCLCAVTIWKDKI
jgi:hypothetical protein